MVRVRVSVRVRVRARVGVRVRVRVSVPPCAPPYMPPLAGTSKPVAASLRPAHRLSLTSGARALVRRTPADLGRRAGDLGGSR